MKKLIAVLVVVAGLTVPSQARADYLHKAQAQISCWNFAGPTVYTYFGANQYPVWNQTWRWSPQRGYFHRFNGNNVTVYLMVREYPFYYPWSSVPPYYEPTLGVYCNVRGGDSSNYVYTFGVNAWQYAFGRIPYSDNEAVWW